MTKETGGPAFPRSGVKDGYGKVVGDVKGMTLRDYFAGQVLVGWPSTLNTVDAAWIEQHGAKIAYRIADAMIAARMEL